MGSLDARGHGTALRDPVAPRFEFSTYPLDEQRDTLEHVDCQSGVLALLRRSGRLEVRDVEEDRLLQRTLIRNPHRVFVHPSGSHVLTTASDGEVYVLDTYDPRLSATAQLHVADVMGAFVQGTQELLVGECVAWLPEDNFGEADGEASAGLTEPTTSRSASPAVQGAPSSRAVDWTCLMGINKGTSVFAIHVGTTLGHPARLKMSANVVWSLPSPAATSLPLCSIAFHRYGSHGAVMLLSTITHLHVASSSSITTPAAIFAALCSGTIALQTRTVPLYAGTAATAEANGEVIVHCTARGTQPQSFVWNSAAGAVHGIFYRRVDADIADANERFLFHAQPFAEVTGAEPAALVDAHTINFARIAERDAASPDSARNRVLLPPPTAPLAVFPTGFHMLVVYPRRFLVLHQPPGMSWRSPADSTEEEETGAPPTAAEVLRRLRFDPFRTAAPPSSELCGVVLDHAARRHYLFSRTHLWEVQIEDEAHQQWCLYLERGCDTRESLVMRKRYLDAAYRLAFYSEAQRNLCQFYRAHFFLDSGATRHAIAQFARCDWFEDVYALLTSYRNARVRAAFVEARLEFLLSHLVSLDDWIPQLTTLVLIVVMAKLDLITHGATASPTVAAAAEAELQRFLTQVVERCQSFLTEKVVYEVLVRLLEEQGRRDSALLLAKAVRETRYVVASYVAQQEYDEAVKVLATCYGTTARLQLWYEFTSSLIRHRPVTLVTSLLRALSKEARAGRVLPLELERLLPSFVQYDVSMNEVEGNAEHQVVVLLDQCIHRYDCASAAVHNYYVCLLAQNHDHDRLDDFLNTSLFYDAGYALRVCLENSCIAAAVTLYKSMHLYRDAVTTALYAPEPGPSTTGEGDTEAGAWPGLLTAEDTLRGLSGSVGDEDLKQLWLLTAQQALAAHNVTAALAVVQASGRILRTEDVLRHVEDDSVVGDFRDAICESFDAYTAQKKQLCRAQEEVYQTAEGVKRDLRQTRRQYGYITASQRCPLCRRPLLQSSSAYFVYPNCGHAVHEACAVARLERMGGLEVFFADEGIAPHVLEGVGDVQRLAQQDCVMCGEAMVVEVGMPLCVRDSSWSI